jgi:hypothetical protein
MQSLRQEIIGGADHRHGDNGNVGLVDDISYPGLARRKPGS